MKLTLLTLIGLFFIASPMPAYSCSWEIQLINGTTGKTETFTPNEEGIKIHVIDEVSGVSSKCVAAITEDPKVRSNVDVTFNRVLEIVCYYGAADQLFGVKGIAVLNSKTKKVIERFPATLAFYGKEGKTPSRFIATCG